MEEYSDFVRKHADEVRRVEEVGRLVALMLPTQRLGRFAEAFQESVYALMGLLSLLHSRILQGGLNMASPARLFLTLAAHAEVVVEMLARLRSDAHHAALVRVLELAKAVLRLLLLGRMSAENGVLIAGGQLLARPKSERASETTPHEEVFSAEYDRADDDAQQITQEERHSGEEKASSHELRQKPVLWRGRRSGKTIPLPKSLSSFSNVENDGGDGNGGVNTQQVVEVGPEDVVLRVTGEVVHILRPLLYAMHLSSDALSGGKQKSWSPFIVSLSLELFSIRCSSVASSGRVDASLENLSADRILMRAVNKLVIGTEASAEPQEISDEMKRRKQLIALYLMRSPLYDRLTLPMVQGFANGLSGLPGIGESLENLIVETLKYYHRNHFYISGS